MTWSVGLTDRLGFFADLPVSWVLQDNNTNDNFSKNKNFGIGDIQLGLNYLLLPEKNNRPDIIGSLEITFPTGDEPDFSNDNKISLGNGHWEISTSLMAIKAYDPVILFGNIGYIYSFKNTFGEVEITPGNMLTYTFGAGFVPNSHLAFFSQFEGSYQTETKRNSVKIQGSNEDQMLIRNYISYSFGKSHYIQPSISFGVNENSPDFILDFSYFHRF
ncbi:transporter [Candidatus Halobeggiatoa sp. HSG11]|nr:transporter [Candidatus Halobeggiatoa sp. HSG11]